MDPICGNERTYSIQMFSDIELLTECRKHDVDYSKYLEPILSPEAIGRSVDDASSSFVPITTVISAETQRMLWRRAVRYCFVDRRRVALGAMLEGFDTYGSGLPLALTFRTNYTPYDRQYFLSGTEIFSSDDIIPRLAPCYAMEGEDEPPLDDPERLNKEHNFNVLKTVLSSSTYAPFLGSFILFVTASEALLGDEEILVSFNPQLGVEHVPMAHTCFRQLVLPAERVASAADLEEKLIHCAQNATRFGLQ